ncbi:MAG: hypothetical protein ACQEQL_07610 [Pseudomonadota bacterium]
MNLKLAMAFSYFARKYATKLPHMGNKKSCAMYLGVALRDQRKLIEDKETGTFMTLYESVERLLEIKMLMHWTAHKFDIPTKSKPPVQVLKEIVASCDAEGHGAANDIKRTLTWAEQFFNKPEVRAVFEEANVEITMPKNAKDFPKAAANIGLRIKQESERLHNILKVAKGKMPDNDNDKDTPDHKQPGPKPPKR